MLLSFNKDLLRKWTIPGEVVQSIHLGICFSTILEDRGQRGTSGLLQGVVLHTSLERSDTKPSDSTTGDHERAAHL